MLHFLAIITARKLYKSLLRVEAFKKKKKESRLNRYFVNFSFSKPERPR